MKTQSEKGKTFRELHQRQNAFIIPNPWDAGSTRLLEQLGFVAVATTSAGYAFSAGRQDHAISRDDTLAHVHVVASATQLPVSADLMNGFGHSPEYVAQTIRLAAEAGAVGGSIEDATGHQDRPIYELGLAADRIRAAVQAARELSFPFTLTVRCENYLVGAKDLNATIKRLQVYEEAGADVLFAPGLTSKQDVAAVVSSLDRPVNALMGLRGCGLNHADLSAIGVKRISVGSALARTAYGAFLRAAAEMASTGTFTFADDAVSYADLQARFQSKA